MHDELTVDADIVLLYHHGQVGDVDRHVQNAEECERELRRNRHPDGLPVNKTELVVTVKVVERNASSRRLKYPATSTKNVHVDRRDSAHDDVENGGDGDVVGRHQPRSVVEVFDDK